MKDMNKATVFLNQGFEKTVHHYIQVQYLYLVVLHFCKSHSIYNAKIGLSTERFLLDSKTYI